MNRTYAPRQATYTWVPASDAAINYLASLAATRTPHIEEAQIRGWAATAGKREVSAKIDTLKNQTPAVTPTRPALPDVPAGRYALDVDGVIKFYKVDRPDKGRWEGYTFVKVMASDNEFPVKGAAAKTVLEAIAVDHRTAMARYGQEIGHCGMCGRTLTDEESRARGIGPDCFGRL